VSPSPFLEDLTGAGLVVERATPSPVDRIFTHEALTLPVVPDAVGETAARWLDLRRSRTPAAELRFHGSIGPRAPEVYAVSRVERFLECPFKYFAAQVLHLDEERDDESGLTPLERGQLLHGVFEAFFVAWRALGHGGVTAANLSDAIALFADVAEAHLVALPEGDRALERTYLLGSAASPGLADRAFNFEIEQGVEVLERLLEYPLEGVFAFEGQAGPRELRVRGKADRIDLLADGTLRIIDYKLGRAPKPARALQLPVYGVAAAQQLEGHLGRRWSVGRAGYVAFKEKNAFVDLGGRTGNLQAALTEGQKRFVEAIDTIEAGEFPVDPYEPWLCTRCGFSHVCRKDYVGDE
jgi:ATP-dependent helicase/nuclease subunit B